MIPWVCESLSSAGRKYWIGFLGELIFTAITQAARHVTSLVIALGSDR